MLYIATVTKIPALGLKYLLFCISPDQKAKTIVYFTYRLIKFEQSYYILTIGKEINSLTIDHTKEFSEKQIKHLGKDEVSLKNQNDQKNRSDFWSYIVLKFWRNDLSRDRGKYQRKVHAASSNHSVEQQNDGQSEDYIAGNNGHRLG